MSAARGLSLIEGRGAALEVHAFRRGERLDSHHFVPFEHRTWLNSRFHTLASYEVQGVHMALIAWAAGEDPAGTLPCDDELIARKLRLSVAHWRGLCAEPLGPLHKFSRVRVLDTAVDDTAEREVRWAHPLLTRQLLEARERRQARDLSREVQAVEKRTQRLRRELAGLGVSDAILANRALVEEVDAWLVHHCRGKRTAVWLTRAVEWARQSRLFADGKTMG